MRRIVNPISVGSGITLVSNLAEVCDSPTLLCSAPVSSPSRSPWPIN